MQYLNSWYCSKDWEIEKRSEENTESIIFYFLLCGHIYKVEKPSYLIFTLPAEFQEHKNALEIDLPKQKCVIQWHV